MLVQIETLARVRDRPYFPVVHSPEVISYVLHPFPAEILTMIESEHFKASVRAARKRFHCKHFLLFINKYCKLLHATIV